jgi:hypothetical protein
MASYLEDPGYLAGDFDTILDASNATVALAEAPDEAPRLPAAVAADTVNLPLLGPVRKDHLLIIVGIVAIVAIYLLIKQKKTKAKE